MTQTQLPVGPLGAAHWSRCGTERRAPLVIALTAMICAVILGLDSSTLLDQWHENNPLWVEAVSQTIHSGIFVYEQIVSEGRLATITNLFDSAFRQNQRHVLYPLVLGTIAPESLMWRHAPLLINIPFFALFLALLGWTVYRRTHSLAYALALMIATFSLHGWLDCRWGIASGFADHESFLSISVAVLCLLNALIVPRTRWFVGFAVAILVGAFARTTSMCTAAIICAPILTLALIERYRQSRALTDVWKVAGLISLIVLPAAALVLSQTYFLLWYYLSPNGWNLGKPIDESLKSLCELLIDFTDTSILWAGLPVMLAMFVMSLIRRRSSGSRAAVDESSPMGGWFAWLSIAWWSFAFPAFLLANGYISDVPKEVMYAVPGIVLLLLCPVRFEVPRFPLIINGLAVLIAATGIYAFTANVNHATAVCKMSSQFHQQQRRTETEMAAALGVLPSGLQWASFIRPDYGMTVSIYTAWHYGKFQDALGLFHNREVYWQSRYPNQSREAIQAAVYATMLETLDAAIVLKDPTNPPPGTLRPDGGMEPYCRDIAIALARQVHSDRRWALYKEVSGSPYSGQLSIYINTTRPRAPRLLAAVRTMHGKTAATEPTKGGGPRSRVARKDGVDARK